MNDMYYVIFSMKNSKIISYISNLHPILWTDVIEDAKQFYSITRVEEEINVPSCKEYFEKCIKNNIIDGLYTCIINNGTEIGRKKLL